MGILDDGGREKEKAMQKEEDILFIPPDMKHSSTLNWEKASQETIYSVLGIGLRKESGMEEHSDSHRGEATPRTPEVSSLDIKHRKQKRPGLLTRIREKPSKSQWRIEADSKKKVSKAPQKPVMEPVIPAIILSDESDSEGYDFRPVKRRMNIPKDRIEWEDTSQNDRKTTTFQVDDVTRFLIAKGIMGLRDSELEVIDEDSRRDLSILRFLPAEYREYLIKLTNPAERKKIMKDIYRTGIVRASSWMIGLFSILYLMPDSRFFAPFIAGFVGGKKAGNTLKAFIAAITPFFIIGIFQILLLFHLIYPFYDIYSPAAGELADYLTMKLTLVGMDSGSMAALESWRNLARVFIYMAVGAVIGGTLESDVIRRGVKTIDFLQITRISEPFQRKI